MNKRIKAMAPFLILGIILSETGTVKADYFEHHKDCQPYCIQAKDIVLEDWQRQEWIQDGVLEEMLIERSEIFVREFRESNSKEPWMRYEGGYDVDAKGVKEIDFRDGSEQKTAEVIFYLQKENSKEFFISVTVDVIAKGTYTGSEENVPVGGIPDRKIDENTIDRFPNDIAAQDKESDSYKITDEGRKRNETNKGANAGTDSHPESGGDLWTMIPVINVSLAAAAFTGFSISLYSDYKVLFKYNRKLKKKRGEEK